MLYFKVGILFDDDVILQNTKIENVEIVKLPC